MHVTHTLICSILLIILAVSATHGQPLGRKGLKQYKMKRPGASFRRENTDSFANFSKPKAPTRARPSSQAVG
ncbi:hypothetical protein BDZ94DRAFT_1251450 [Collybia nuda]|uniref:Secreted protein n=1 Tax=Collybia nuda TaxID=64659 RepID=A0A9P5YCA5_9AGAR|nr:hypothetical protein BDZ94DRAFT_1251450 [Collybia nuda]